MAKEPSPTASNLQELLGEPKSNGGFDDDGTTSVSTSNSNNLSQHDDIAPPLPSSYSTGSKPKGRSKSESVGSDYSRERRRGGDEKTSSSFVDTGKKSRMKFFRNKKGASALDECPPSPATNKAQAVGIPMLRQKYLEQDQQKDRELYERPTENEDSSKDEVVCGTAPLDAALTSFLLDGL